MFRNVVLRSVVAGVFLLSVRAVADTAPAFKVALVDLQDALQKVEEGKKAKSQLEKEMKEKMSSLEKTQKALQKETEEFDKKAAIMSDTARSAKQAEIQKKIAEFQKAYGSSQMELQQRERELTKPIIEELRKIVEGMGKGQNFSLVLEKNEGAVLYAQNSTDLTKEVIDAYNSRKRKK